MQISYKKLWKHLIDLNMKKSELGKLAGISSSTIAKLGRNENVNVDVLVKICIALDCGFDDLIEIEKTEKGIRNL